MFSNEKEVRQEMKKFSQIEYVRPDMEVEKEKIGREEFEALFETA